MSTIVFANCDKFLFVLLSLLPCFFEVSFPEQNDGTHCSRITLEHFSSASRLRTMASLLRRAKALAEETKAQKQNEQQLQVQVATDIAWGRLKAVQATVAEIVEVESVAAASSAARSSDVPQPDISPPPGESDLAVEDQEIGELPPTATSALGKRKADDIQSSPEFRREIDISSSDSDIDQSGVAVSPPRRFLAKRRVRLLLRRDTGDSPGSSDPDIVNAMRCGFESPPWDSIKWWTNPQLAAVRPFIERNAAFGGLLYRPRCLWNCASTAGELMASRGLGVPWSRDSIANEKDKNRRDFLKTVHEKHLGHIFHSMAACSFGSSCHGDCAMCGDVCIADIDRNSPQKRIAWLSGGPPCTPHTVFRTNKSEVAPDQHRDFDTIFGSPISPEGSFLGTVVQVRPLGGSLEEVGGFAHLKDSIGRSYLEMFEEELSRILKDPNDPTQGPLYTAVRNVTFKPRMWMKIDRTRTHVFQ